MAGYMHMKMNPNFGFDEWYSQCKWYEAYQFSIKLVYGPKFWKPTSLPPPLPLVERKMIRRPRKRRIRYPTEDDEHVVTREASSSSIPPPTATPSTSNIMPPSTLNTMPPPPTPSLSTLNTMPPPSGSNTMPLPPIPSGSNIMPALNTSTCRPAKSSASSSRGGSRGGATSRGGSKGVARGGSSKRGRGSNSIPLQGLRDEASDENGYEEEHSAQYKGMPKDVAARKQPMTKDVAAGKQPMIKDESLQGKVDLPIQESTIEANPKPTRSKKSKVVEVPDQMRIFHKNRGIFERIFNQKMKNFMFDEHGTGSTPDKAFDVER
ncbi:hypothetical protein Tco_0928323 [Tanacetum coccineum]